MRVGEACSKVAGQEVIIMSRDKRKLEEIKGKAASHARKVANRIARKAKRGTKTVEIWNYPGRIMLIRQASV